MPLSLMTFSSSPVLLLRVPFCYSDKINKFLILLQYDSTEYFFVSEISQTNVSTVPLRLHRVPISTSPILLHRVPFAAGYGINDTQLLRTYPCLVLFPSKTHSFNAILSRVCRCACRTRILANPVLCDEATKGFSPRGIRRKTATAGFAIPYVWPTQGSSFNENNSLLTERQSVIFNSYVC